MHQFRWLLLIFWCNLICRDLCVLCIIPIPLAPNRTQGTVWPKPFSHVTNTSYLALRPSHFNFKVDFHDCDIVQEAVRRYYRYIFDSAGLDQEYVTFDAVDNRNWSPNNVFMGFLDELHIHLTEPCKTYPSDFMDEKYELIINSNGFQSSGILVSKSVWGILRGLETFSQVIIPINGSKFGIHVMTIVDFPRYTHRGLLIDTSRHYLPLKTILQILEAMAYSKLNVLHWHITDDQSFPFQSIAFPSLSAKGAYDPYLAVYTHTDVKRVIEYARLRGIRVIPEFDTPGHTLSWGKGLTGFLTKCFNPSIGEYGPVDPTLEQNYSYLETLFREIVNLFPDSYLHLGGDEVEFDCWESNPQIRNFMRYMNIQTYSQLEAYYIYRILNISEHLNAKVLVWQEVYDNNVPLDENTIIHVWKDDYDRELSEITRRGYKALLSSCWYLDHVGSGGDWIKFYEECNPFNFSGTPMQKRLVLGGEACMWGESVDETNIQQRIWPRACATAEILWSGYPTLDAAERLEEHVCRLKKRGIPAQPPNGPGFCPYFLV